VVADAPWLPGHRSRVGFLLDQQRPDGGWGGPDTYALVPTLSATHALLGSLLREHPRLPAPLRERAAVAVDRGLAFLAPQLKAVRVASLPDTPAIEVIIPFLVGLLQAQLVQLRTADIAGLDGWRAARLVLPRGLNRTILDGVAALLAAGQPAPLKVLHSLEVAVPGATGARGVPRLALGTVGASPAATAAWLGPEPVRGPERTLRYLRSVISAHGGPVPSVTPIINFERAWVVDSLALGGVPLAPPRRLAEQLAAALGTSGISGGAGLPPDADTTSATLAALRHLGVEARDGVLRRYDQETHFCTWPGERTASPTTNAHVLSSFATAGGRRSAWRESAAQRTATWLCGTQGRDGFWSDKWHASPFYATACVVAALRDAGVDEHRGARQAADRAVESVLASQHRDGSWGRWAGTAEETAYALQILLYRHQPDRRVRSAATRGHRFLLKAQDLAPVPLWHDKDLYVPGHVVRAAVVGARHLAETTLGPSARPAASVPRPRRVGA